MIIKIKRVGAFDKMLASLYAEDEELGKRAEEAILRFQKNPSDTRIDNHRLTKRLKDKWAFSVTNNIRIVYEWQGKKSVRFLAIGTHFQVYSRYTQRN